MERQSSWSLLWSMLHWSSLKSDKYPQLHRVFCFHLSQLLDKKIYYATRISPGGDISHLLWDIQLTILGTILLNILSPLSICFIGIYHGNIFGVSYKMNFTEHTNEFSDEVEHTNAHTHLLLQSYLKDVTRWLIPSWALTLLSKRWWRKAIYNTHRRTTT